MTEADILLERWRHTHSDNDKFICDGIVNENEWSKATDRVLFLLKELNLGLKSYSASLSLETQRDFRKTVDEAPWREIGQWAYAILHRKENPSFKDANANYENACKSIAIVNYKKIAGDNASSTSDIRRYAIRDKDLINEQINLINPNIIICCGKGMSFQLAKELFQDARTASLIHRSNSIFSGSCWKGSKYYWVDYVHPSMRVGTREQKYNTLLELVDKIP